MGAEDGIWAGGVGNNRKVEWAGEVGSSRRVEKIT
jgi:hypothetical protein